MPKIVRYVINDSRIIMLCITATELRNNLNKYMELSQTEDVYVTENGKVFTVLTSPDERALKTFLKLKGCLKKCDDGSSYEDIIGKAIEEHELSH